MDESTSGPLNASTINFAMKNNEAVRVLVLGTSPSQSYFQTYCVRLLRWSLSIYLRQNSTFQHMNLWSERGELIRHSLLMNERNIVTTESAKAQSKRRKWLADAQTYCGWIRYPQERPRRPAGELRKLCCLLGRGDKVKGMRRRISMKYGATTNSHSGVTDNPFDNKMILQSIVIAIEALIIDGILCLIWTKSKIWKRSERHKKASNIRMRRHQRLIRTDLQKP